jgi:predicted nucleic acid-binding protein
MILACAVEGEADFIISGDHHLTGLKTYQSIRIIDPATFVAQLVEARKG